MTSGRRTVADLIMRAKRFGRRLAALPFYTAERLLLASRSWTANSPQLFILGLPRSGTTLVYQYIVHRLDVGYFTNGVGRHYLSPCLTTWWQRRRHGDYRSDFRSSYGKSAGALAPREAGAFWGRFFGVDNRVETLSAPQALLLQKTVACVQRLFGDRPFVNKNVKHLLRLRAMAEAFPEACFLVVERELPEVAASLLRGRSELPGDSSDWLSVKPTNYEALAGLSPLEQVAGQVVALQEELASELRRLPDDRVLRVTYGEFCRKPEGLIDELRARWPDVGYRSPARTEFERSTHRPRTPEEYRLAEFLAPAATTADT